jgi:lactoylglutathione lyase
MGRPFRILGVQQIAIGGPDRGRLSRLWVNLLGLVSVGTYASEAENVDEEILSAGRKPFEVEIDLMQPIDPDRKPQVHSPALNHVGLWVDDLHAARDWLAARGVRFAGDIRKGATGHEICFIHPRGDEGQVQGGEGVLIELVQAPPALVQAFDAGAGSSSKREG